MGLNDRKPPFCPHSRTIYSPDKEGFYCLDCGKFLVSHNPYTDFKSKESNRRDDIDGVNALDGVSDDEVIDEAVRRFPFIFIAAFKEAAKGEVKTPLVAKGAWVMLRSLVVEGVARVDRTGYNEETNEEEDDSPFGR